MTEESLKLVIASGGTGGHISPVIAVLTTLRDRCSVDATWIGGTWGIEREAAARAAVPFVAIQSGKLRRYFSWQTPVDALRIPLGYAQAYRHLRRIRPAVVFSTGGYVAVPTALAAARLGIPVLTHEQTAQLGLATRIIARSAAVLALSFPLPEAPRDNGKARVIVTGNPVRASLFAGDAARGAAQFGLSLDVPTIYATGGARGSSPINERIERALPLLLPNTQIIHATGPTEANGDYPRLRAVREDLSEEWRARYVVVETLGDDLRDVYALAALVVGRSGAAEMLALLDDPARRARMSEAARALAPPDAANKIAGALLDLARRPKSDAGD
ncbi:MAG: glycosyltransferase [Thermomicrobia bacterium]|nr:glycosyltransferase [Thermomicrobia bacterium]